MAKKKAKKKRAAKKSKKAAKKKSATKKKATKKKAVKKPSKKAKKAKKKATPKKTKKKASPKKAKKKAAPKKTKKKASPKKAKKKAAPKKAKKKAAPKKAKKKAAPKKALPKKAKVAPKKAKAEPAKPPPPKKRHIPQIARPLGTYGGVMICEDPKPFPKTSPYSRKEVNSLQQALKAERDKLVRELASLQGMGISDSPGDTKRFATESSEYSADMQAAETIMGVRSLEEERLEQVVEALERIESSSNYGLCLACGNKIGIERLIAKPHAHLCMDCRRIYEGCRFQEA